MGATLSALVRETCRRKEPAAADLLTVERFKGFMMTPKKTDTKGVSKYSYIEWNLYLA